MEIIKKKLKNNKIYNVASGKSITLNSLSKILVKYFGQKNKTSNSIAYTNAKKGDIIYSKANLSKIKKEIKFSPIFKLKNEIKKL